MVTLPIDAVPDITNNQVQIVTISPTLAPQEVEQLITFPIEIAMSNIMNVEEIRSVSRFGLSLVTVVFKESVPTLQARQLISEQIQTVAGEIPTEPGTPEMMPVTTGLGEIYQYTLDVAPGYEKRYDAMELLNRCLHRAGLTVGIAFTALALSLLLFTRQGAEFIPTLDEGDFAMQMTLPAGSSLTESIEVSKLAY